MIPFRLELLDLRIQIEERFQAGAQLLLDLFLAAFEHVHGHVRLVSVGELYRSLAHFGNILGRQQPTCPKPVSDSPF